MLNLSTKIWSYAWNQLHRTLLSYLVHWKYSVHYARQINDICVDCRKYEENATGMTAGASIGQEDQHNIHQDSTGTIESLQVCTLWVSECPDVTHWADRNGRGTLNTCIPCLMGSGRLLSKAYQNSDALRLILTTSLLIIFCHWILNEQVWGSKKRNRGIEKNKTMQYVRVRYI